MTPRSSRVGKEIAQCFPLDIVCDGVTIVRYECSVTFDSLTLGSVLWQTDVFVYGRDISIYS